MSIVDYFSPSNQASLNNLDADFGTSGQLLRKLCEPRFRGETRELSGRIG